CFLSSVGSTKGDGGLAQRPTERGAAGLGDLAGLRSAGGFLEVRGQPAPELQGVGVGEAGEVADLRGDDATPDLVDPRHALEDRDQRGKTLFAVGEDNLPPQRLTLPLDQADDVQEVAERLALNLLEQMPVSQQPLLSVGA